jgi:hypothetical protein
MWSHGQLRESSSKHLLIRCIVQVLLTEGLSFWFFVGLRSYLGEPLALRLGLMAPVFLFVLLTDALKDTRYVAFLLTLLVDTAFVAVVTFSIIKKRTFVGNICLLVFNLIGIVLIIGALG